MRRCWCLSLPAVIGSYQSVGTLLVFGLLVGPPATRRTNFTHSPPHDVHRRNHCSGLRVDWTDLELPLQYGRIGNHGGRPRGALFHRVNNY